MRKIKKIRILNIKIYIKIVYVFFEIHKKKVVYFNKIQKRFGIFLKEFFLFSIIFCLKINKLST